MYKRRNVERKKVKPTHNPNRARILPIDNQNISNLIKIDSSNNNMEVAYMTTPNFTSIPKIFHCYWDGSNFSFLHYLTLVSFRKHHPDWKMILYMPKHRCCRKPWKTVQVGSYNGPNYLSHAKTLCEVKIIDFNEIGFKNDVPEVIKSDFLRYHLLYKYGGMWSDMDTFYIKNIESIDLNSFAKVGSDSNITFALRVFQIGILLSAKNNSFFKNLRDNCLKYLKESVYQCLGTEMIIKMYSVPKGIISKHPSETLCSLGGEFYTPLTVEDLFERNALHKLHKNTVALHWYFGDTRVRHFLISMNKNCTMYHLIKNYLK
jgi:hypothetical protein